MPTRTNGTAGHVLIVDDDELARNLVQKTMERGGYRTSLASSAAAALEHVRKGKIDVVISDIQMPEMSGLELLRYIKEYDDSIPVILLTAHAGLGEAIQAVKLGAQDFLVKPSNLQEIRDSVAHAIIERDKQLRRTQNVTITISLESFRLPSFRNAVKRLMDIVLSLVGLILLFPVMAIIYLLIRWQMGSPVIFRQQRPGLHGRIFMLYKFRSMINPLDKDGNIIPDDQRITKLGRFLRASSLDELPELFNVLKGDMSLVGPRPLLVRYLDRYTPFSARRHEVRPGITGWAQVNGRNNLTWEEKFELDVWYVDHYSLWLDLKILFLTFIQVLKREGIGHQEQAIMPEYVRPDEEEPDWMAQLRS